MMEENNNIFLAGGDALVYLAVLGQCTKNIPQHLFGAIHLVLTYLRTNFSTTLSFVRTPTMWMHTVLFKPKTYKIWQPLSKMM